MIPCPRGCGWDSGNPETDESGMPYTCYVCCNTGEVTELESEDYERELELGQARVQVAAARLAAGSDADFDYGFNDIPF